MRKPVVAFATNNSAWKNKSIWTPDHLRDYVLLMIALGRTEAPDAASVGHKGLTLGVTGRPRAQRDGNHKQRRCLMLRFTPLLDAPSTYHGSQCFGHSVNRWHG